MFRDGTEMQVVSFVMNLVYRKEELHIFPIALHFCSRLYHWNEIFTTGFFNTKRKAFPLAALPERELVSENIWFLHQDACITFWNKHQISKASSHVSKHWAYRKPEITKLSLKAIAALWFFMSSSFFFLNNRTPLLIL